MRRTYSVTGISMCCLVYVFAACTNDAADDLPSGVASSSVATVATETSQVTGDAASETLAESGEGVDADADIEHAEYIFEEDRTIELLAVVTDQFPHDPSAFTQGLSIRDGLLYESTGLYGESSVRIVDLQSGEILVSRSLDDEYFGEGLEVVGDRVVQLTWREETAFIWDAYTLEPLGTYTYEGEGWGLCERNGQFVMSNGSDQLTIRDGDTFEVVETLDVRYRGEPVDLLNELECTQGWIYANVWKSDLIMVIDPGTGFVFGRIHAGALVDSLSSTDGIGVLNGIAYEPLTNTYYLTGKLWPAILEVRVSQR